MKLTIIPADKTVYKDGNGFSNLNLLNIPSNIHALQFNATSNVGWIEFVEDDFGNKAPNEQITLLPDWAVFASAKWDEAKLAEEERIKAEQKANTDQPITIGTQ